MWPDASQAQQRQQQVEDNQWGGFSHQPTEAEVQQRERAAGINSTSPQQKSLNQDVQTIYQNLMGGTPPGSGAGQQGNQPR